MMPQNHQFRREDRRGAVHGLTIPIILLGIAAGIGGFALAHDSEERSGGLQAERGTAALAPFDIVHAKITTEGNIAVFRVAVAEGAGQAKPEPTGEVGGAPVFAYVWPTNIDPGEVGFESGAGTLALAVTIHPDFDDTPLFDEGRTGRLDDDGGLWHSHWVVLGSDDACGPGALKVIDIPEGASPSLPLTWPGLPVLVDSPGWSPIFAGDTLEVRIPFADIGAIEAAHYDAVTAGLRVNANLHAPFLCVVDVFDIASGDLSLPARVND